MNIYEMMKSRLDSDEKTYLVTTLTGPRKGDKGLYDQEGQMLLGDSVVELDWTTVPVDKVVNVSGVEYFVQLAEQDPRVLVLGAGHVSRAITDLLLFIGCHVTVVDDRAEYLRDDFFDSRVKKVCCKFEELKEHVSLNAYTGFMVVTRAHEFDNVCLNQLHDHLHRYIGVMGSAKRVYHALEAMKEDGWTSEELARIYGPIGLDIGSDTPEEIALSIVSEYLAVVRHKNGGFLSRKGR